MIYRKTGKSEGHVCMVRSGRERHRQGERYLDDDDDDGRFGGGGINYYIYTVWGGG